MKSKLLNSLAAIVAIFSVACGGGGGDTKQSNPSSPSTGPVSVKNMLFVSDKEHRVLAGIDTLSPSPNTSLVGNVLSMAPTADGGVAYDVQKDLLYAVAGVLEVAGNSIVVFEHASTLQGSVKPSRTIHPVLPTAGGFKDLILDKERDIIYASIDNGNIAVFKNASKLNGSVAPDRLIRISARSFAIDFKRSILYVKHDHSYSHVIYAYSGLDTLGPVITEPKMIIAGRFPNVDGLALDSARDRLYLGTESKGVAVVENASKAGFVFGSVPNMPTTDTPTIALPINSPVGLASDMTLAFDTNNDRLYVGYRNIAVVVNAASTLTTTTTPTNIVAVTAPNNTFLGGFAFP